MEVEISYFICSANEVTGFYIKCKTKRKRLDVTVNQTIIKTEDLTYILDN